MKFERNQIWDDQGPLHIDSLVQLKKLLPSTFVLFKKEEAFYSSGLAAQKLLKIN